MLFTYPRWCKSIRMQIEAWSVILPLLTRRRRRLLCLVFLASAANYCIAQKPQVAKPTVARSVSAAIDDAIQRQIKKYNIPGLAIAVTRGNRTIYSRAYGWADLENRAPATPKTLFRVGSITKPITATAAFVLAEHRRLDLDASVQRYCATFPEKPEPVTTRELLAHLGGVRGFRTDDGAAAEIFNATHYDSLTKTMALFANDALVARPGTRYEYSHYGYELVGCVLEGAAGQDFEHALRAAVFTPAGMTATRLDDTNQIIPHRSSAYTHTEDRSTRKARYLDTSNRIAAAGLLSTANDLARFAIALDSGKLLPASSLRNMWSEQVAQDGTHTGYGLGWMIREHDGKLVAAHTGELPGASSILYVIPDEHVAFTVLANTDAAGLWPLANRLADVLSDAHER